MADDGFDDDDGADAGSRTLGTGSVSFKNTGKYRLFGWHIPCPACDESFSVDNSVKGNIQRKWSSPNYPNNYTDGCNCTLTVNITGAANIHIGFANSSKIYDDSGCMHDRLLFDGSFAWVVCGSKIDQLSRNFSRVHNDMYFTATFVSDSGDGNKVATGFEMMLKVHIP
ncbi:uncharacterized protein LOC143034514 isoform X4 [Oratosquilla oratoria]|uniref:uncharacterized protein LOC143034514 isoform X4 n=1 Tax=Oratosquilla oratoria TaxID=337810 RepID=UPI003F760518